MQCIVTLFHCIMGSLAYRFVPAVVMPFRRHADTPRWMVIMQHALQHYRFTGITIGMLRPLLYYGEVSQQQRCLKCMCLFAGVGLATCCTPGGGGGGWRRRQGDAIAGKTTNHSAALTLCRAQTESLEPASGSNCKWQQSAVLHADPPAQDDDLQRAGTDHMTNGSSIHIHRLAKP